MTMISNAQITTSQFVSLLALLVFSCIESGCGRQAANDSSQEPAATFRADNGTYALSWPKSKWHTLADADEATASALPQAPIQYDIYLVNIENPDVRFWVATFPALDNPFELTEDTQRAFAASIQSYPATVFYDAVITIDSVDMYRVDYQATGLVKGAAVKRLFCTVLVPNGALFHTVTASASTDSGIQTSTDLWITIEDLITSFRVRPTD